MKKKILIVEDEYQIRQDLELILNLNNYDTFSAENGFKALEILNKTTPDLIICDVMMPQMNGFELLEKIQHDNKFANIPFLFLTAKTDKKDFRHGMNLGADDYIIKPFNLDELLKAIELRLTKKSKIKKMIDDTFEDLRLSIKYSLPHEIRNPINVILGFSELLKTNFDSINKNDAIEMLDNIYTSGLRLHKLFERYILLSKLNMIKKSQDDLKMLKNQKTKNANEIIKKIADIVSKNYDHNQKLQIDVIQADIAIDEEYFSKMIEEVIDNAIKFAAENSQVNITANKNNKYYIIEIFNIGIGMKPDQINRIGEYIQFERKQHEQQGLGLGLSIVKNIIEIFDGTFTIESEAGSYTKIIIKLPLND